MSEIDEGRFRGDETPEWTPIAFAVELTRRLRRHAGIACTPSLRATIAIPRFLTARYARTKRLTARDYLDAAILTTPFEDQAIAESVARELLFPRAETAGAASSPTKVREDAKVVASAQPADPVSGILGDLAALDVDLDALADLADLESMIDDGTEPDDGDPFELFERLYSSADPEERALGELVVLFGGAAEMASVSARTVDHVRVLVRERLLAHVGALTPAHVLHACNAGFGTLLAHEARHPWEIAGFLAGLGRDRELRTHLADLASSASPRDLGATLRFVAPHAIDARDFRRAALARPLDLAEHAELLLGFEEYVDPPAALIARSAKESPRRAMNAARTLRERFGHSVEDRVLDAWASALGRAPTLRELVDVAVESTRYHALVEPALETHVLELREEASDEYADASDEVPPVPHALAASVVLARDLAGTKVTSAVKAARRLATEVPCTVRVAAHFLPLLDELLEHALIPDDLERLVEIATLLGIDPNEVYDRIGQALEQLRAMILGDAHDADRYARLVDRIASIPQALLDELCGAASASSNLEAIAALLAIDLGGATQRLPEDLVMQGLGFKGIGGGSNLLKQWFSHRGALVDPLKSRIKAIAKEALIDLAFEWLGKSGASAERGLIPESRTRPMRAGDDLDLLDLDASLERVIDEGRRLDDARDDDLLVSETVRGRAAVSVLIDISGSMSGPDLAMCSIAVVMLLGKLRADEVSLALFESDTHVVKRFADEADLDAVADELLDLHARGGTCVDQALRFVEEEMSGVEATLRVLFVLSDFAFSERPEELRTLGSRIADHGVSLIAAAHGYVMKESRDALVSSIGGETMTMKKAEELPALLLDVLSRIADGR
ncbi:VWA domain-containing protein [Sandaracinus amylolyticus]|uniref:ATPase n=1 Tax=Sandaracinus amylolyticus TaxID=927083 RepID=A0A0F6W2J6_9BACT|nr:vWA domain-containing protein [Sandaracinus amylolyticus]AKF05862.1 ATPase [Sandaracinus amylolyticus]